jgi:ribosomal-protein-alanine N-acetyltransferase
MKIRRMTLDDIGQVLEIDRASFNQPWPERSFRFEVENNPASRAWVAEQNGRIVGMIVAWLMIDEAHIATIATHPQFRRQGIASHLLRHALDYMRDEGAVSSFLEVRESNLAAQELYRRFGFEETGRRPRYYKDNGEDAILMLLESLVLSQSKD